MGAGRRSGRAIVLVTVTLLGVAAGFVMAFWGNRPAPVPSAQTPERQAKEASTELGTAVVSSRAYVLTVGGSTVVVRQTGGATLRTGQRALVVRKGEQSRSGPSERYIATIRLVEQHGDTFIARPVEAREQVRPGDEVRRPDPGVAQ